jgi:hypothetical protein
MNEETASLVYVFAVGVLVGMVLSDILARMEYKSFVREMPEFLKEERDK